LLRIINRGTGFVSDISVTLVLLKRNVMKKLLTSAILLSMFATVATLKAQPQQEEYLGLPGDNLNLFAVMKLFQESSTLEGFERDLNDQNFRINNLDLNGDNMIDYITVRDYVDRNVHTIVLQDPINRWETQDVAVFTVQRFPDGQVQIQLIGDEALYGKNYIIEPITDEQLAGLIPNPGYNGYSAWNGPVVRTTYFEIAAWPLIRFIYMPGYIAWRSAWRWGYYPVYWHPWRPYYWHFYYGYQSHWYHDYYSHYRYWNHPRWTNWNNFYYSHRRSYSPYVSGRIKSGNYKATYSHPDQKRKGEALYTETFNNNGSRRNAPVTVNTGAVRTESHTTSIADQTGHSSVTSRRAPSAGTNTAANRKSMEAVNNTRSTTVNTPRSYSSKTNNEYKSSAERKSSANAKPAASSRPKKSTPTIKSAGRPATTATASSSRRSSQSSKAVKQNKSSEKKKSDEKTKSARR
jgi:hypothetical protein